MTLVGVQGFGEATHHPEVRGKMEGERGPGRAGAPPSGASGELIPIPGSSHSRSSEIPVSEGDEPADLQERPRKARCRWAAGQAWGRLGARRLSGSLRDLGHVPPFKET